MPYINHQRYNPLVPNTIIRPQNTHPIWEKGSAVWWAQPFSWFLRVSCRKHMTTSVRGWGTVLVTCSREAGFTTIHILCITPLPVPSFATTSTALNMDEPISNTLSTDGNLMIVTCPGTLLLKLKFGHTLNNTDCQPPIITQKRARGKSQKK